MRIRSNSDISYILGLFADGDQAALAVRSLGNRAWKLKRVHGPFAHHGIMEALGLKKSRVGLFTLAGGIVGFFTGIGLAVFTATRWHFIVSGKPIVAWVPFFIVGFECTILFSVLATVVGFLTQARLPDLENLRAYDPRCSGDRFGIVASCLQGDEENLKAFFREKGGEGLPFDQEGPLTDDGEK